MMLMLQLRITVEATLVLFFAAIILQCKARVHGHLLSHTPNKEHPIPYNIDYPNLAQNDEENEVISVRLQNTVHLKSVEPSPEGIQNVSFESVQKTRTGGNRSDLETKKNQTSTTGTNQWTPTTPNLSYIYDDSLEEDWVRSQIEIPASSEEGDLKFENVRTTVPLEQLTTITTPKYTTVKTTTLSQSTFQGPIVFGYRRRKARNHDYYDELPEINFDEVDLDGLADSEMNEKQPTTFISSYESESIERPIRRPNRWPKKQPTKLNVDCPCASEKREQPAMVDDYDDQPTGLVKLAPLTKRFLNRQNHVPTEDFLDEDLSMERAERVQGALERIMGIVTIMSHVDSFIHKKTKQSIRRLAKLYQSEEE